MAILEKKLYCFLALCMLALLCSACGAPAAPDASPTPAATTPLITPTPPASSAPLTSPAAAEETPVPPGEPYDIRTSYVPCEKAPDRNDIKRTWKVNAPTESPDPNWTEQWDGDTVTYTEIICGHGS